VVDIGLAAGARQHLPVRAQAVIDPRQRDEVQPESALLERECEDARVVCEDYAIGCDTRCRSYCDGLAAGCTEATAGVLAACQESLVQCRQASEACAEDEFVLPAEPTEGSILDDLTLVCEKSKAVKKGETFKITCKLR